MKIADTRETIIRIQKVIDELDLTPQDIFEMVEKNDLNISMSSIRRLCEKGAEEKNFDFQNIVAPIGNLLIDINGESDEDSPQVSLMKELILAKIEIIKRLDKEISDLKLELAEEELKHRDRIQEINDEHMKEIHNWMHQIELKDNRMDKLFSSNEKKDAKIDEKDEVIKELSKQISALIDKCNKCPANNQKKEE